MDPRKELEEIFYIMDAADFLHLVRILKNASTQDKAEIYEITVQGAGIHNITSDAFEAVADDVFVGRMLAGELEDIEALIA